MRIKLKNVCYPKPLLAEISDDYLNNIFRINIKQEYNKTNQKLKLSVETTIDNDFINQKINEGKIAVILHLEQKTQRELIRLEPNSHTEQEIDLYKYSTTDAIEVVGVLYCVSDFEISDKSILNTVYKLLDDNIVYERGDIIGYSNEYEISLPEDKRIGSIFNLIPDEENLLNGQPFSVSLDSHLIQIIMSEELHEKYIHIYKKDQYVKKILFSNIVYPGVLLAFSEMLLSYEQYKDKKWCITLANKIEKKLKKPADEIFVEENYEIKNIFMFANYALEDLFKDSIDTYYKGMEE